MRESKSKRNRILNFLLSLSVFLFALYTLLYGLFHFDVLIFFVSLVVILIFINFAMVTLTYLLYPPEITTEGENIVIKIGNGVFWIGRKDLIDIKIERISKFRFLVIKAKNVKLETKPNLASLFARIALFSPAFASSYLTFGMMAPFFRDEIDMEAWIEFNRNHRGGEISINTSLIGDVERVREELLPVNGKR